jgi:ABC-type transport system involved in multi-copper enzyme maturation permease subunit
MIRYLYLSATFLLNSIGDKNVRPPAELLDPTTAFVAAALYTLAFLFLAIWLYRRQDLGG